MEEQVYYLSGPMSNIEDHNFPMFAYVAEELRKQNFQIRSPHETQAIADYGTDMPYEFYIRKDIEVMMECSGIILLPGWMHSKGARIELNLALDLNFDIYRLFSTAGLRTDDKYVSYEKPRIRIAPIDQGFLEYDRI